MQMAEAVEKFIKDHPDMFPKGRRMVLDEEMLPLEQDVVPLDTAIRQNLVRVEFVYPERFED